MSRRRNRDDPDRVVFHTVTFVCGTTHDERVIVTTKVNVRLAEMDVSELGRSTSYDGGITWVKTNSGLFSSETFAGIQARVRDDGSASTVREWSADLSEHGQERYRLKCRECPADVVLGPDWMDRELKRCVVDGVSRVDIRRLWANMEGNSH